MKVGVGQGVLAIAQLGLLLMTLLACMSSSELTSTGGEVQVSSSSPADQGYAKGSCKNLGYIIGHGGGVLGGWVANDELVQYAMNDLRNKAAELGANYVEHDSPQMGVTAGNSGSTTTTATVSGTAYQCDDDAKKGTPTPKAVAAKPKEKKLTPVPGGAAGFKFGMKSGDAEALCASASLEFKRDGALGNCSGTPTSVGTPATSRLSFCDEGVCGIDVLVSPPAEELIDQYNTLHARLVTKYGKPKEAREAVSDDCRAALAKCLETEPPDGARWVWPDGHSVSIRLVLNGETTLVEVSYRTPQGAQQATPGPAL